MNLSSEIIGLAIALVLVESYVSEKKKKQYSSTHPEANPEERKSMISSMIGIAFDCQNANELADFYVKLSGWEREISGDEFAAIRTPQGILLVFQTVENYVPPVWPWEDGKQQQMAHIDFKIDNLQEAVEYALKCGAKKADVQYYDTSTVMLDPEGHPFCLSTIQQ